MTRDELEALGKSLGMTPMGAALDRMMQRPGEWLSPPARERIGRRLSRPKSAYRALVKRGAAETDGAGKWRVVIQESRST